MSSDTLPPYVELGSGPAVVFAHGTLMDKSMFEPQMQTLSQAYRVISFDSRARTGPWDSQWKIPDLVDDTIALLNNLGIERCVLAGMSVGGFMAMDFALTHPHRLDGLILIDGKAEPYHPDAQEAFGVEFAKLDIDGTVPREWAEWCAPFCFSQQTFEQHPELVEHWMDIWCSLPARSVYREAFSWLDKPDRRSELGKITVPTLIVHGELDAPIPFAEAEEMTALIPAARLAPIPGAGHTSNLEHPDLVSAEILAFLRSIYT